jgi:hypothetical protein
MKRLLTVFIEVKDRSQKWAWANLIGLLHGHHLPRGQTHFEVIETDLDHQEERGQEHHRASAIPGSLVVAIVLPDVDQEVLREENVHLYEIIGDQEQGPHHEPEVHREDSHQDAMTIEDPGHQGEMIGV